MRMGARDGGGDRRGGGAASADEEHQDYVKYSTARLFFVCFKQARSALFAARYPLLVYSDPAVAVFVLLAGAARTGSIARGARVDPGGGRRRGSTHRYGADAEAAGRGHHRPSGRPGGADTLDQRG